MHCVHRPAQSIIQRLAGEKALSQGGCFLVLPALLFQWAPLRPRWWTLWSSLAGCFGTLFNLASLPLLSPLVPLLSLPQPVPLTSCFHQHLPLSQQCCALPFWQWWLLYLSEFSLAKWFGLQRPATLCSRARASQDEILTAWKQISYNNVSGEVKNPISPRNWSTV